MCDCVLEGNLGCWVLASDSEGDCCCCCCDAVERISAAVIPPSLAALSRCGWLGNEMCDADGARMEEADEEEEEAGADVAAVIIISPLV